MKSNHRESVMVLGVAVKKLAMPEIYRLARVSPKTLKLVLEGVMAKRGFKNPVNAMDLLESDLEYKNFIPPKP